MIVVGGEALVDLIPVTCEGETHYSPHPGGSPANVAVGLARLGSDVAFVGKLSRDAFGRMLHSHLSSNGVDLALAPRGPEPTTLALVHPGNGEPQFSIYAHGTAAPNLTVEELPGRLPGHVGAVHVGSFSLVVEPIASALEAFVERAGRDVVVTVDPNIRPPLMPGWERTLETLERWIARAQVIKASVADIAWLYPGLSTDGAAARWLAAGAAVAVVSMGARGALARSAGASVEVDAFPVDVVDTVGAGDSLMAGLLAAFDSAGLLERNRLARLGADELRSCVAFACRVAGEACRRAGADPPRLSDVGGRAGGGTGWT